MRFSASFSREEGSDPAPFPTNSAHQLKSRDPAIALNRRQNSFQPRSVIGCQTAARIASFTHNTAAFKFS
jgi:hypothetical protein